MQARPAVGHWAIAAALSLTVHAVAYVGASSLPPAAQPRLLPSAVEFDVPAPPPPSPASEPSVPAPSAPLPPEPAPAPSVTSLLSQQPTAVASASAPDDSLEQPPGEQPLDLTGVTLTGGGDASWSSVVGDGRAMRGPLGPIGRRTGRTARSGGSARGAGAPTGGSQRAASLVAARDLARPPIPPNLDHVLRSNYPAAARRAGVGGSASVRACINADGRVARAVVLSESYPGFGAACHQTVVGSRWSPPLDRRGRAVSTTVLYTCTFRVQN